MPRLSLLAALTGGLLPLGACQPNAGHPAVTTGTARLAVEAVQPLAPPALRARRR